MVRSLLAGGSRKWYTSDMRPLTDPGNEGLPRAIPSHDLQIMLGTGRTFSSEDVPNPVAGESMDRWPFLFSRPLMKTARKPDPKGAQALK